MSRRSKKEPRTMGSLTPLLIAFPKSSSTELKSVNASSSNTKSFDQLRSYAFPGRPDLERFRHRSIHLLRRLNGNSRGRGGSLLHPRPSRRKSRSPRRTTLRIIGPSFGSPCVWQEAPVVKFQRHLHGLETCALHLDGHSEKQTLPSTNETQGNIGCTLKLARPVVTRATTKKKHRTGSLT